jgi:hypothetical protein
MGPFLLSLLVSLRDSVRPRAALQAEVLALRHQLMVLQRSRRPRLAITNPLWGAPRTQGELRKLGVGCPNEPSPASSDGGADRPPKRGGRSWPITRPQWSPSTSSRSPHSPAGCCSCSSCSRRRADELCTSMSRSIPRLLGPPSNWSTPFRTMPRPGGCCGIVTPFMASGSVIGSRAWGSPKSSQPRRVHGRIRTWSG